MEGNRQWDMGWEMDGRGTAQHNTTMKDRDILGVSSIKAVKACLSMLGKEGSKEACKEDATKQPILPTTNTQQLEQHQQPTASLISSPARTAERPPPGQASGGSTRFQVQVLVQKIMDDGRDSNMVVAWPRHGAGSPSLGCLRVSASLCLVHCRYCSRPNAPCCLPCALRPSSFSGRLCMI